MKVLLFNGSNKVNGCTFTALSEIAKTLNAEDIETEILQIGAKPIRDCIGCNGCNGKGRCVFDDDIVNEWINKCNTADGFIFGTPVYYAIRRGEYSLRWTDCSMPQEITLRINPPPSSHRQGVAAQRQRLILFQNISVSHKCPLFHPLIGIWYTAIRPNRPYRI